MSNLAKLQSLWFEILLRQKLMEFYFEYEVCKHKFAILLNIGLHCKCFLWVLQKKKKNQKGYAIKHAWAAASLYPIHQKFCFT